MEIHLLQEDRIKEMALYQLLESKGYDVTYTENRKVKPRDIFKREKPLIMLMSVNFLSSFGKAEVLELCNKQHRIILLGILKQLYWLFEFSCYAVGFICQNEKINNVYDAIKNLNAGEVYLSRELTSFLN